MPPAHTRGPIRAAATAHLSRIAAALITAVIPTAWLLAMDGWPQNHEFLRVFRRVGVIAGQWRLGHLIPVWSTTAFNGGGSPSPILYHKAFNALATLLGLLTGSARLGVCLAIVVVLATLFLGVAKSCRVLLGRNDLLIEATAGMMAVFASYTTTDWLIRDAMSETAAMAGTAWVFAWCLVLIQQGRFALWIGPLMTGMYLAHPVIAYYCAIPLAVAAACAWRRWRGREWAWARRALVSIALCAALAAPWLIVSVPFARYASLDLLTRSLMSPRQTHLPFGHLFHEERWHWQDNHAVVSLQIDRLMQVVGVLAIPAFIIRRPHRAAGGFLIAVCAIMLLLQTSWALPVYDWVPGAAWIQFTFRLQSFVTVALALCAAPVLDTLRRLAGPGQAGPWPWRSPWVLRGVCAASALVMSLGKPWLGHAPSAFYGARDVTAALSSESQAPEPWEYAPSPPWPYLYVFGQPQRPAIGCLATPLDDMTSERATARFAVGCTIDGAARLPIALAPGMDFLADGRPATAFKACPEALARLAVPVHSVVTVTFPTFWSAAAAALRRQDPALTCKPYDK